MDGNRIKLKIKGDCMNLMGLIITTDKKQKLSVLEEKTSKLLDHLVKLYMYPNHENAQQWRQEIADSIRSVQKVEPSNKFPKKKDILKYTWYIWEDAFLDWVKVLPKDYGKPTRDIDLDDLYHSCQQYFEWLANELATIGLVSRKSIYDKLINLGF